MGKDSQLSRLLAEHSTYALTAVRLGHVFIQGFR